MPILIHCGSGGLRVVARKWIHPILLVLLTAASVGPGAEWVLQNSGTDSTLAAVHFSDVQAGYVTGFLGTILKTLDGGTTWESLAPPTTESFSSVFAKSPLDVFIGRQGLYRSINGGEAWQEIGPFPEAPFGSIFDIQFTSDVTGFFVKQGEIFRTQDGGESWSLVFSNATSALYLSRLETPDAQTIYGTGGISYDGFTRADFVRSYDGGETWEMVPQPGLSEIEASAWVGPREGYAFTYLQRVLKTTDGGDSWMPLNEAPGEYILDATFVDAQSGCAVGYSGNIFWTTNGGVGWVTIPASAYPLAALARPCDGTVYAVGNEGKIFKREVDFENGDLRITGLDYDAVTGNVALNVHSTPCRRYRIDVSLELSEWSSLGEITPETADWQFNVGATGHQSSFFRVVDDQ